MSIIKRIISFAIWTFIILNVLVIGASKMPTAQRFIGQKVAQTLGEMLDAQVNIGRIDLGFLNRIIVDDLVVYDQQQKEMLRAARMSVKISLLPLSDGKLSISSAQLFGAHARLYKNDAESAPNFQFVIDKLSSNDTTSTPLNLRINSLIIRHSSVTYDQLDKPVTTDLFNPNHLKVSNISAHMNLRTLTDDSLNVNVKRMSFNEQSGLTISRLSFRAEVGREHALLRELQLQMPSSLLKIDTLMADYQFGEKGIIPGTLSFTGCIPNTSITPSDLRCFVMPLKNFQRPVSVEATVYGTDQKVNFPTLRLFTSERDIDINVNGWIENWQKQIAGHVQIDQIQLSEYSIDFLTKVVPKLPSELTRLGGLQLSGTVDRNLQGELTAAGQILSGAGNMTLQFAMDEQQMFECQLESEETNLRQLLNDDRLGSLSAKLSLHGQFRKPQPDVSADGLISRFEYKGYSYENISLSGHYIQHSLSGICHINDPNATISLEGQMTEEPSDHSGKTKKVILDGTICKFVPTALHLTDEWENSEFSADIHADFTASNINDAIGNIRISKGNVTGTEHHQPYKLDNLIVISGYEDNVHFVSLKSDFAEATLKGKFDYATLPQSIAGLISSKLPTLPGLPATIHETNNNFSLHLMMSKTDWLKRFLGIDLVLNQPFMLNARINDSTREVFLDGDLPSFAYNGRRYSDAMVHITTPDDTLKCYVGVKKNLDNGQAMDANFVVRAANNNLNTSLVWDNHLTDRRISGQLNSIIQLYRNLDDLPEAHLRVQPSHVVFNDGTWDVEPSDIIYNKQRLLIDNFLVRRGNQHIQIDGIASKSHHDTLTVDLNKVEVAYILDLVNFHSVEFSGKATGHAKGTALLDQFAASADLRVDDFKFEDGRMGVLYANIGWNEQEEQIDIRANAEDGPDVRTIINGFVSPTHNTIDLAIHADSTYIDFMHSFTKSFLSQATGHANGDVRLAGTLDNINLTGLLIVDGIVTVESLNTTYTLEGDTVKLIPDEIELHRLSVHDKDGHQAFLSGGIHHRHLTNLTFDLEVDADNLLAYDFPDFGDSNFYGTVYATGHVTIQGRPGEVTIDCDVTPQRNSFFVYNAATTDELSHLEFIEWEENDKQNSLGNIRTTGEQHASQTNSVPLRASNTDIYLNFLINATPDATLKLLMDAATQDYITLNGDGTIRATFHNKGAFNMFGTYTVDHGTYDVTIQNIISKNFIFNRGGTITFGGDPYQAALNLQAVYTVSGVSLSDLNIGNSFSSNTIRVNCLMNITGQAAAPQIDFDLEMPTVNADEQQMVRSIINGQQEMNQQVIYLLGIGRFYTQGENNASETTQSDATSLAMQSLLSGTLSAQINSLLNQFVRNDNWNLGANITTGNEGWHNAEYEGIVNGRMLNNRLLLNGQFGYRDNASRATPSFIGDFDIQYLLYPNGNLALKVYNQTNDRYFTKSSLNTQGLGIIMKKDFNGFRDLFSSKRKKKKAKDLEN